VGAAPRDLGEEVPLCLTAELGFVGQVSRQRARKLARKRQAGDAIGGCPTDFRWNKGWTRVVTVPLLVSLWTLLQKMRPPPIVLRGLCCYDMIARRSALL
jgi:hypothetical protein